PRPQLALQHLAGRRARQWSFAHDDPARPLVACEALAARGVYGGCREPGARGDDHGHYRLAPAFVGHAEHRRLRDALEPVDDLLDLLRVDVEAAGDDQILLPTRDGEVALLVDDAEVAGVQPAVAKGLGGLGR